MSIKRTREFVLLYLFLCPFLASGQLIVCSNSILSNIVSEISGDKIEVRPLVPIGMDPHTFEPKAADIRLVSQASVVFINGLQLEPWLQKIILNSGFKGELVVVNQLHVSTNSNSLKDFSIDPHTWMNPLLVKDYLALIADTMIKLWPEHVDDFVNNMERYQQELLDLDAYIDELMESINPENRLVISMHDSFRYFGIRYGLRTMSLKGISTESDIRVSDIAMVSHELQSNSNMVIFRESTTNPKVLFTLVNDFDARIGPVLFTDSLGKEGSGAESYIKMMRSNALMIHAYLTSEKKFSNESFLEISLLQIMILPTILLFSLFLFIFLIQKNLGSMGI